MQWIAQRAIGSIIHDRQNAFGDAVHQWGGNDFLASLASAAPALVAMMIVAGLSLVVSRGPLAVGPTGRSIGAVAKPPTFTHFDAFSAVIRRPASRLTRAAMNGNIPLPLLGRIDESSPTDSDAGWIGARKNRAGYPR
jgi:hypothetical protein